MTDILDLFKSEKGKQLIKNASTDTGASEEKTASVLKTAMPLLLSAMQKNAQSPEGASNLLSALSGKHDGSLLDNLGSMLGGSGVDENVKKEGGGILSHLLGGKQDLIAGQIAQKLGMESGTVNQILKIAAPVVLSFVGKKKQEHNVDQPGGLSSLLDKLKGSETGGQNSLESLLDRDKDGDIMDDVSDFLGKSKGKKNSGGLGGLFGK